MSALRPTPRRTGGGPPDRTDAHPGNRAATGQATGQAAGGLLGRFRPRGGGMGGVLLMVGGTLATQVMALGTGIVTARLLGVEGRGQVALVMAVATLVARLTLGGSLPVAVAQLLARDRLPAKTAMRPSPPGGRCSARSPASSPAATSTSCSATSSPACGSGSRWGSPRRRTS